MPPNATPNATPHAARGPAREGPPLEQLLRRVAEAPADVLAEPRVGRGGRVHVAAVVGDLLAGWGARPAPAALAPFAPTATDLGARHALGTTLLLCWLLADPWFAALPAAERPLPGDVLRLLEADARALAVGPARRFVEDPDRREELARTALAALGLRPAGETPAQAEDRLASISTSGRARVLAAARAAEQRARAIREALQKQAAAESADKWTRE